MASPGASNIDRSPCGVDSLDALFEEIMATQTTPQASSLAISKAAVPKHEFLDMKITSKTTKKELKEIFEMFGWADSIPSGKLHRNKRKRADTKARLRHILLVKRRKIAADYVVKLRKECEDRGFETYGDYAQLKARLEGITSFCEYPSNLEKLLQERGLVVSQDTCDRLFKLLRYEWEQGVKRCEWDEDCVFKRKRELQFWDTDENGRKSTILQPNSDASQNCAATDAMLSDKVSNKQLGSSHEDRNVYDGSMSRLIELKKFDCNGRRTFGVRNVIGDGNCLPRALAVCLWGRYEEKKWRQVKKDVADLWKEAMTDGTPMSVLRGTDYNMLALHVSSQRSLENGTEMQERMPELIDQIDPDGNRWCTDAYLQLVSDCYDVAIFTFSESYIRGKNKYTFTRFAGRLSEHGQLAQRQIFLANDGNHWKALLPGEPFCVLALEYQRNRKSRKFENDMSRHQQYAPIWSLIPEETVIHWNFELPLSDERLFWECRPKYPRVGEVAADDGPNPLENVGIQSRNNSDLDLSSSAT
jgi:hypothetical protein